MYVIFLQSTHWIKKTLTVSCTLLCESGDRVKVDKSSFSADLHAVMLRHHCSEYAYRTAEHRRASPTSACVETRNGLNQPTNQPAPSELNRPLSG